MTEYRFRLTRGPPDQTIKLIEVDQAGGEEEPECPHDNIIFEDYCYVCLDCNKRISREEYKAIKNRRELES